MGARLVAVIATGYAVFQLGGGPWYGYWYGVILLVVDGMSTGLDDVSPISIGHEFLNSFSNPELRREFRDPSSWSAPDAPNDPLEASADREYEFRSRT
ncbi:MAG: hypothetical protein V3R24_01940 [Gemmatimonadales bacterium]